MSNSLQLCLLRAGLALLLLSAGCKTKKAAVSNNEAPPAGYTVVNSTSAGRAFSVRKRKIKSVKAALKSTLADLAPYFDEQAVVQGAYEDRKNHRSGGALFTAIYRGQPVKGTISCKIAKGAASIAVVVADARASQSDWAQLVNAPAAGAAEREAPSGNAEEAPAESGRLTQYNFPDGSGYIGIADGWHTNAQTCASAVVIEGPQGRQLALGVYYTVVTPDSTAVQTQRQLSANAMQMGQRPQPFLLLVAPYSDPLNAVRNLAQQLSQQSVRNRGPAFALDHITFQRQVQPWGQGGNAAVITYGVTENVRGRRVHYQVQSTVETTNMGGGSWLLAFRDIMQAPDNTFQRDLSVMQAMVNSWRSDSAVITRKSRENIDASNQRFAIQQRQHRELNDAFDAKNRGWEQNQRTQARSADDFSEAMRGTRTIEDTRTGERHGANLGNVDNIVDSLNEHDPGRYQQIPLRDELDPNPR